ncbi:hephaestin-like protein [Dendronephthya gigantea]|uniref:hephaestin-like protein n=1 Tax=Dendronephthya gigantea TaxID=151771 RepID=UPI00106B6EBF|nr:hephaestin-like protein [Dendronephthya gigantea]
MAVWRVDFVLSLCLVLFSVLRQATCETVEYHIAAVEIKWDYGPSGYNQINGKKLDEDSEAKIFTKRSQERIGRIYNKIVYRECADSSCKAMKKHPDNLGILGPIFRAVVGDVLKIHFTNRANRNFSVHPHGVFYLKDSEGALYNDNTAGRNKEDDGVPPNGKHTYTWEVKPEHGPTNNDSDCLTWAYHSHVNPRNDVNTGLVGAMIICKKGTFINGKHKDIDKDFVLLFTVMDENRSWLLKKNIKEYCGPNFTIPQDEEEFKEFRDGNNIHMINGYIFGNVPDLKMCVGDVVDWHLFGMGSETDLHSVTFHGHTVRVDGHRSVKDAVFPARSSTAHMTAWNPGKWLLRCLVNKHYISGMTALFDVDWCPGKAVPAVEPARGKTREYFITAEETLWDYAPSGMDKFNGGNLASKDSKGHEFFVKSNDSIGGQYWKALYFEYTDESFTTKKPKHEHLGFLGPVIRAEVGDTIKVTFRNKASRNFSIHAQGVFYNKSNEGLPYQDGTNGSSKRDDMVEPNITVLYTWTIPDHLGPTEQDPDCLTSVYTSSVDPVRDVYSGLVGPLLICKKGTLDAGGKQKNFEKEFIVYFTVTNENKAWYIKRNAQKFAGSSYEYDDDKEGNLMHGINGYLYANLPGLDMCLNKKISWHIIGLGDEVDIHGVNFHGQTFEMNSNRKDTVYLIPGSYQTISMQPDNPGEWALVCRTNDHFDAGMVAKFRVNGCNSEVPDIAVTNTKTYYIAAVEEVWDYAPTAMNNIQGTELDKDEEAKVFAKSGPNRIGRKYKKAIYRRYSDSSFTKRMSQPDHLGILGPMIKAEVGDRIRVVFKNMASRNYSVHPHGVFYDKQNEGALYLDNTTSKADDAVPPGQTYTYTWRVPQRAGPSETDNECITWSYYSHVNPTKDTNTGLVGPLIICRKGSLDGDKTKGVDREFPLFFSVIDENQSWNLNENFKFCSTANCGNQEGHFDFVESNSMNAINGRIYGNLKGLEMKRGEKVNWYLMTLGTEIDMHNVHFHGQTVLARTVADHREDVVDLFPGVFMTVKMVPDSTGRWLLHCHVNDHMAHGMEALYDVTGEEDTSTRKPQPTSLAGYIMPNIVVFVLGFLSLIIT